ncbi:MAG: hypothetical protein IKK33_09280 [Lachnospiraceae bacterium]|nr:hypothetical protein [Lachnospiraceae bacterium]
MGVKILAYSLIGVFMAPFFAIFATPIMVYLRIAFYVPFIREKLLQKAKDNGHVINAKLQKTYDDRDKDGNWNGARVGIYTYEHKGKKCKTRLVSHWGLSDTVNLYYIKNPKKAMPASQLGVREQPWIKMYFLTWGVLAIVFTIIGMVTEWQFLYV